MQILNKTTPKISFYKQSNDSWNQTEDHCDRDALLDHQLPRCSTVLTALSFSSQIATAIVLHNHIHVFYLLLRVVITVLQLDNALSVNN